MLTRTPTRVRRYATCCESAALYNDIIEMYKKDRIKKKYVSSIIRNECPLCIMISDDVGFFSRNMIYARDEPTKKITPGRRPPVTMVTIILLRISIKRYLARCALRTY